MNVSASTAAAGATQGSQYLVDHCIGLSTLAFSSTVTSLQRCDKLVDNWMKRQRFLCRLVSRYTYRPGTDMSKKRNRTTALPKILKGQPSEDLRIKQGRTAFKHGEYTQAILHWEGVLASHSVPAEQE